MNVIMNIEMNEYIYIYITLNAGRTEGAKRIKRVIIVLLY